MGDNSEMWDEVRKNLQKDLELIESLSLYTPTIAKEIAIDNTRQLIKSESLNKKLANALELALESYDDWADGKLETMTECMNVLSEYKEEL